MARRERERVSRVDREQDLRAPHERSGAEPGDHDEPDHHDRAEEATHALGAAALEHEQRDDDRQRKRDDVRFRRFRDDGEALDRRYDGDRGRDDAVAEQHRRADDHHQRQACRGEHRPERRGRARQRQQREDAAFTVVIDPHHETDVLDAHDEDQRPHQERADSQHRGEIGRHARDPEADFERVERAGPDVSEHDTHRADDHRQSRLRT